MCELCNTEFNFKPGKLHANTLSVILTFVVYAEGAPKQLSRHELLLALLQYVLMGAARIFRLGFIGLIWLNLVPLIIS